MACRNSMPLCAHIYREVVFLYMHIHVDGNQHWTQITLRPWLFAFHFKPSNMEVQYFTINQLGLNVIWVECALGSKLCSFSGYLSMPLPGCIWGQWWCSCCFAKWAGWDIWFGIFFWLAVGSTIWSFEPLCSAYPCCVFMWQTLSTCQGTNYGI